MAAGDAKKIKLDEENIFTSFHRDKQLEDLKSALELIETDFAGYGVGLLKIIACNAVCSNSFSRASCSCEEFREDGYPIGFGISSLFEFGFQILEDYVGIDANIPSSKGAKLALSRLLHFLMEDLKDAELALTNAAKGVNETNYMVRLAHHLLSKLSISSNYKLDNLCQGKCKELKCPCDRSEKISGTYGDTSIGISSGWHGRVDILMDDVPVKVTFEGSGESDSPVQGNFSSVEVKATPDIVPVCREQIRAQAIVFSFWQQKIHPELNNFLIPNIAISKEKVAFCFYDCKNDVLLETPLFSLVSGTFLHLPSVIVLWLALNFKFFCSGLSEEIEKLGYKADLFKFLGDNVKKYRNDVVAPCDFYNMHWLHLRKVKQTRKRKSDSPDEK